MIFILKVALAVLLAGAAFPFSAFADQDLSKRIDKILLKVLLHEQRTDLDTPWAVMHGIIAFGKKAQVLDADQGKTVNSIDYLLKTAYYAGMRIFHDSQGYPDLITSPKNPALTICQRYYQVQDHPDQYLMALADAGIPLDTEIFTAGATYTVQNLLNASLNNFDPDLEVGWSLAAYSSYISAEKRWQAKNGKRYGLEDMLALAIKKDPVNLTEGGTHHLYGIAKAYNKLKGHMSFGLEQEAELYLRGYAMRSERYQQEDGAFSGKLFLRKRAPKTPRDLVDSTGHIMEWLTVFLSAEELKEEWVARAVNRLCQEFEDNSLAEFNTSGMYHAAHALKLYKNKVL